MVKMLFTFIITYRNIFFFLHSARVVRYTRCATFEQYLQYSQFRGARNARSTFRSAYIHTCTCSFIKKIVYRLKAVFPSCITNKSIRITERNDNYKLYEPSLFYAKNTTKNIKKNISTANIFIISHLLLVTD